MIPAEFVAAWTVLDTPALVPEIRLHLATELTPLWQATEAALAERGVAPPYWAFAWPGSQALARYVLDGGIAVGGRRVLDFAAGSGLAAIACALRGAQAEAAEIDALARAAIAANAAANGVALAIPEADLVGVEGGWDIVLAGDVFYEQPMTARILPWLRALARRALVLVADPGRAFPPRERLETVTTFTVPTTLELEDRTQRLVTISRLLP
ncbi:MAG: methyltransferase [Rhodospirillales bacterium]|nr:methyltransferase [Rhodospirillales bacterium]